jgi:hypothetical protein
MKKIYLTQGKFTIVDDSDYKWLIEHKWYFNNGYAVRGVWLKERQRMDMILMHREILKVPDGLETDHINLNRLDNQKCNLRIATTSQNQANRFLLKNNTSGFKGVSWKKSHKVWSAKIRVNGKRLDLGYFKDKMVAVNIYNEAATKYFGEFARLN